MMKVLKAVLLPLLVLGMFAAVPMISGAAAPPDTGTCHNVTNPTPAPGSSIQPAIPVVGSQVWHHPSGKEVGIKGSNGFLVVKDNQATPSASVQGRLNAVDLRGNVAVGVGTASACLSVGTTRVRISVP